MIVAIKAANGVCASRPFPGPERYRPVYHHHAIREATEGARRTSQEAGHLIPSIKVRNELKRYATLQKLHWPASPDSVIWDHVRVRSDAGEKRKSIQKLRRDKPTNPNQPVNLIHKPNGKNRAFRHNQRRESMHTGTFNLSTIAESIREILFDPSPLRMARYYFNETEEVANFLAIYTNIERGSRWREFIRTTSVETCEAV